ncbi:MAG: DUF1294 domain-containing protein [Ruminococcus sp.]
MAWYFWLLIYLAVISLISVIVTVCDKHAARKRKNRVSENTLMLLSVLGGSVFMYLTMHIIRHKTKHLKFMLGIPLIFGAQCAFALLLYLFLR